MSESAEQSEFGVSGTQIGSRHVESLLERAARNIPTGPGQPNAADLSRSISDTYYALFAYLTEQIAANLIGTADDPSRRMARNVLCRSVSHTGLATAFRAVRSGPLRGPLAVGLRNSGQTLPTVPGPALSIAELFLSLRELRGDADYNRNRRFSKDEVQRYVHLTRETIERFDEVPTADLGRRWFLSLAAVWDGLKSR